MYIVQKYMQPHGYFKLVFDSGNRFHCNLSTVTEQNLYSHGVSMDVDKL